ncbi:hypothetical protein F1654_07985 [Alkalicaulis satelles]|uniref:Peptidase A2 domain-containing protein n=1 Tax=Alkalicaulis satelles TaxID=2609175 RepID=A0A5M6ZG51_9PROT|nr:retropepsin-like aspartic protease [Alkalicaulis satelles]KAA5803732.1 hypothetical protein F1654_07985 [Alkalicaulis satelles]
MLCAPPALMLAAALAFTPPAGADLDIPLTRSADGHFVVRVDTPGGALRLVLDTGAEASALTRAAAVRLDLPEADPARLDTLTGSAPAQRRHLDDARLGDFALPGLRPVIIDHAPDSARALDGFLGLDAFAGEAIVLDLRALRVIRDTTPACDPRPGLPQTGGTVQGAPVRVRIDTGLAGSVAAPRLTARIAVRDAGRGAITGAGGTQVPARLVSVRRVVIDDYHAGSAQIALAGLPVFADADPAAPPVLIAGADLLDGAVVRLVVSAEGACARVSP